MDQTQDFYYIFIDKKHHNYHFYSRTKKLFYNYCILHKKSPLDFEPAAMLAQLPPNAQQYAPGLYFSDSNQLKFKS